MEHGSHNFETYPVTTEDQESDVVADTRIDDWLGDLKPAVDRGDLNEKVLAEVEHIIAEVDAVYDSIMTGEVDLEAAIGKFEHLENSLTRQVAKNVYTNQLKRHALVSNTIIRAFQSKLDMFETLALQGRLEVTEITSWAKNVIHQGKTAEKNLMQDQYDLLQPAIAWFENSGNEMVSSIIANQNKN